MSAVFNRNDGTAGLSLHARANTIVCYYYSTNKQWSPNEFAAKSGARQSTSSNKKSVSIDTSEQVPV